MPSAQAEAALFNDSRTGALYHSALQWGALALIKEAVRPAQTRTVEALVNQEARSVKDFGIVSEDECRIVKRGVTAASAHQGDKLTRIAPPSHTFTITLLRWLGFTV